MTGPGKPTDDWTLGDARDWLRARSDDGERCPCCTQFVKVYVRALPSAAARVMIALWHYGHDGEYVYLPPILDKMTGTAHQGGYGTLSHHWGLIEAMPGERDDGSSRVGWWRLTALGRSFVANQATVPKYAHLYDGRCLAVDGPPISIRDALGTRFNYRELMDG